MIPLIFGFTACGVLNSGYAYVLAFLLIAIVGPVLKRRQITLNFVMRTDFWVLAAFGLSYVLFAGLELRDIQNYFLLPLVAYVAGWCSFEQGGKNQRTVVDNILGIALGFALYACLNYSVNAGHNRHQLIDFWSGSFRTATGSGFLNTIIFSILTYTLFLEKRKWLKLLLLIASAICVLYVFMLGTRTQLLILAVMLVVGVFLLMRELGSTKNALRLLAVVVCAAALVWLAYTTDFMGFGKFVDSSNLIARFVEKKGLESSNSQRFSVFVAGLKELYLYPFGNAEQDYCHNLWLDVGRVSGILPFALLLCFHIMGMVRVIRIYRDKKLDTGLRYLVLLVYLGVLANFFVEPILQGMLNFFLAFCAINGLVDSFCFHRKRQMLCSQNKPQ